MVNKKIKLVQRAVPAPKDSEDAIQCLLRQLILEEKISMIHGNAFFHTAAVERLGIPELKMSDGPMGVRQEFPDDSWIPVGYSDDYVTYNPSNSALAATWNPDRARESGRVLGEEARGRGKDVILAPGINIKRDPLCGRNFEYMSEDPCLIETLAVPFIQGVQESDVAACVKHFAANNQETDRLWVDTVVDERTLQEIYYPAFRAAVQKGQSLSLMNAYNKLNGAHCSENRELLDHVLREKWEYDGVVISDWGSVHTTREAANASIDVEMSVTTDFDQYFFAEPLRQAVEKGEVSEEEIDRKVENILRLMFRLKMLGPGAQNRKAGKYNSEEHRRAVRQTAEEAIVLLKNEQRILPITEDRVKLRYEDRTAQADAAAQAPRKCRIAVIGQNAVRFHAAGGGSAEIKAFYEVSPLMGLKKALGGNVEIAYAEGYYIPQEKASDEINWQAASLERQIMDGVAFEGTKEEQKSRREEILERRRRLREEACALAAQADEVIFVGGLNHDYDQEGRDRTDMRLPYGQDELIEALLDVKPDMIVVMVAGSPVEMPWRSRAKALVWCYYSGMETGTALAEILLGQVNPSARLPETFPVAYHDTVTAKNGEFGKEGSVEYREGIFVGYRYYEKEGIRPAFPFGFGLSYTQFSIDHVRVLSQAGLSSSETERNEDDIAVTICADVTNTGALEGAEVIQCYVADCACSVERPVKELRAYQKVFLRPGETKSVSLKLPYRAFAFYDVEEEAFVVEPGDFRLYVGSSSEHCPACVDVEIA